MSSIFEAIGGLPALEVAVERFYERVTADPELASFFVGMDLHKLKYHQIAFLGQALGGPIRFNGRTMQRAHAHLRIEQRRGCAPSRWDASGTRCSRCPRISDRRSDRAVGISGGQRISA
jgi:hypothetical protein